MKPSFEGRKERGKERAKGNGLVFETIVNKVGKHKVWTTVALHDEFGEGIMASMNIERVEDPTA